MQTLPQFQTRQAEMSLFDETRNPPGVDLAEVLHLQALILGTSRA
jgi:hypothetical protein